METKQVQQKKVVCHIVGQVVETYMLIRNRSKGFLSDVRQPEVRSFSVQCLDGTKFVH